MTVSNPASFSSIKAEFGGGDSFSAYYRGGPYVPASANSGISTTANGLSMSQFNGVTAYTPMTVSVGNVSGATKVGDVNQQIGTATINVSSGRAPFSYSTAYVSGDGSIQCGNRSSSAPIFSRTGNPGVVSASAVFRSTVTDATSAKKSADFTVTDIRVKGGGIGGGGGGVGQ